MAIEPDATDADPDALAQRLEDALDRIAASGSRPTSTASNTAEIAAQLDRMIDRLRDELAADAQI